MTINYERRFITEKKTSCGLGGKSYYLEINKYDKKTLDVSKTLNKCEKEIEKMLLIIARAIESYKYNKKQRKIKNKKIYRNWYINKKINKKIDNVLRKSRKNTKGITNFITLLSNFKLNIVKEEYFYPCYNVLVKQIIPVNLNIEFICDYLNIASSFLF